MYEQLAKNIDDDIMDLDELELYGQTYSPSPSIKNEDDPQKMGISLCGQYLNPSYIKEN